MVNVKNRLFRSQASVAAYLALVIPFGAAAQRPQSYDFMQNGVQSATVDNSMGVPRMLINGQPVPPLLFKFVESAPHGAKYLEP